jgi:hypothetical protein
LQVNKIVLLTGKFKQFWQLTAKNIENILPWNLQRKLVVDSLMPLLFGAAAKSLAEDWNLL